MIRPKAASAPFTPPATDYTLGERICRARDSVGLSTAQLARRLGVKTTTLQGWESDRSEPRSNKLVMLAGLLNVSPTWLLVGRGTPPQIDDTPDTNATMRQSLDRVQAQALALVDEIERLKLSLDD
ncbi:helix-turn-helix domain-containing protein [Roseibium sp.]|uniref:helix-turn-helix domain-containing protein n=1 Tax=Roseibium sp. TaxID=1936156 RepID=UPI0032674B5C